MAKAYSVAERIAGVLDTSKAFDDLGLAKEDAVLMLDETQGGNGDGVLLTLEEGQQFLISVVQLPDVEEEEEEDEEEEGDEEEEEEEGEEESD